MTVQSLEIIPLKHIPHVRDGDAVATLIATSLNQQNLIVQDGDILVIAQKIISKAEGREAHLTDYTPSPRAIELGKATNKDPRLVEAILSESKDVVTFRTDVLIVEHRLGYVHANAGIDQSNVREDDDKDTILLLPVDSDKSAAEIRGTLEQTSSAKLGVIINDSLGRAWRIGTMGHVIGASGVRLLHDMYGEKDLFGRMLETTKVGLGDELAAAASFVMGQGGEGVPVVLIRGAGHVVGDYEGVQSLLRDKAEDLFR